MQKRAAATVICTTIIHTATRVPDLPFPAVTVVPQLLRAALFLPEEKVPPHQAVRVPIPQAASYQAVRVPIPQAASYQAVRRHILQATAPQRSVTAPWIPTMKDITPSMRMMILTGIAMRAMMIMRPAWMLPWKMRMMGIGKL